MTFCVYMVVISLYMKELAYNNFIPRVVQEEAEADRSKSYVQYLILVIFAYLKQEFE